VFDIILVSWPLRLITSTSLFHLGELKANVTCSCCKLSKNKSDDCHTEKLLCLNRRCQFSEPITDAGT
jgi:hypothetical protein